jgi:hypothetical protein
MTFETNVVVCPHCNQSFEHNKINGVALIEAASDIEKRKRMYCKLSLDALERLQKEDKLNFPQIKKIILDNFNDYTRDIHTIIGFGRDAE